MGKSQKTYMSIRSKLMAAVAMLLVASFMVVSSTYAWFTLSTAPEVTGIKTTVGANGSLEIALLDTKDGTTTLATIKSEVGDGAANKLITDRNKTWGNLVDLSDKGYGLDTISLLPSRLNVTGTEGAYSLIGSALKTPVYSADGRVDSLEPNIVTGTFDGTVFKTDSYKGVRVLGTASGMTAQQIGFRNALSTMTSELKSANRNANTSLTICGPELASIAAAHTLVESGEDNGPYDITKFSQMFNALDASLNDIADMIKAYIGTELAVAMKDDTEANYKLASAALASADLADIVAGTITYEGGSVTVQVPAGLSDLYNTYYVDAADALKTAKNVYGSIGEPTEATWADVEDILIDSGLLIMDNITINDFPLSEVKANMGAIFVAGVTVQLPEGSGIHANIAKLTSENLTASISLTLENTPVGAVEGYPANMVTTVQNFVTLTVKNAEAAAPSAAAGSQVKNITDTYGYILDFAFRTNAASSDLQLQTAGVNRIYSDGTYEGTMGKGSTMNFKTLDPSFTTADVAKLMKAIRLVFVDETLNIVAIGAVDGANTENAVVTVDGTNVTGDIYLYDYTITNEVLTLGAKKGDEAKLMSLEKNKATQLSVYVYLDGDMVDNSMVAANAESSMSGTINLQFSSSAELVPMQYTPLMDQDTTGSESASTSASTSESTSESN